MITKFQCALVSIGWGFIGFIIGYILGIFQRDK